MKNRSTLTLGIIILLIVVFTGWFVWHSKQTADQTLNAANKSANSQTTSKPTNAAVAKGAVTSGAAANNSVQQGTLSQMPDLMTAVIAHLQSTNGCLDPNGQIIGESGQTNDPQISYIADNSARITVCQANQLYAKVNGTWQFVAVTQGYYKCDALQQYKIPAVLVAVNATTGVKCDAGSGRSVTYKD